MLRSSSSSCSSSEGEVDQLPRKRNSKGVKSKGQLQVPVHRAPPLAPSLTPSSTPSLSPCPSPVQTLSSRSSLAGSSSSVQGTTLAPPAQPHSGQAFPPSPRPRRSRPARDDRVSGDPGLGPDQRRLQLYVLLARCASLPFCAKQPPELTHQRLKINKQQLFAFKIKVWNFLEEKPSNNADENFCSIVQEYYEVFLCSRKVEQAFEAGGWSSHELRQAFFRCLERGLQNYDSISMREVMQKTSMSKFEVLLQGVTEESSPHQPSLGKDQLLEMFQKVLGIPKLEHQRIYNACQLDNADEQVAQIRRELGRRRERAAFAAKMKTFLDKNMEKTYVEEVKTSIQQLIDNLESLPLGKGGPRNRLVQHPVVSGDIASGGRTLAKYNINISFSVEVVVMEATGLVSVPSGKQVYCTMEMEGGDKLQTEAVDADKPKWHTQGDFTTAAPLPVLKVRLLTIVNKMLSLEDKELGKVTLRPSPMTMKPPELHDLITPRHSSDENLQLLLHLRMERPPNLKHSGYLLARGKNVWRSWKKRFYALIQGSACTYILCNFQENKVEPQSIIQLDGYTVDYAQLPSDVYGGQVHFSLVREGETFHFGCDDAQDAGLWVQALYRATGQTHRPTLHGQGSSRHRNTSNAGACSDLDPDKASKLIDKVLAADPCDLDHESLFELLQRLTFRHRMKDPYCSLGWFSPGQLFMLDEYCSRYGVSGCHRHLCYLDQLINRAEDGIAIDPTLLHYSYAFCTSHITQNKPDGFSSITVAENAHYKEIKDRIKLMLEHQISHFRFYFPFGLPEGALKATVGLLEKVLMEDMSTPVPAEQIHSVLSTCLRRAAMINYMGLSAENGVWDSNVKGLEELQALAEECVDLLLQSEEQHGMLLCRSPELFKEYSESFWSLFAVDMDAMLNHQPDYSWEYFSLFHLLNRHLSIDQYLCNGPFHIHLQNSFEPILDSYLETMEASIAQSVHRSLQQETWHPIHSNKSATSLELLGKLQMLQSFITDLQWPNENYAASIDSRLKNNANDVMACCINRMGTAFEAKLKKMSKGLQMRVDETLCSMYNLLGDAKQQLGVFCCSDKQKLQECKAWIEIEKTFKHMTSLLITRLVDVLHDVLSKLARYDLGTLFSSILSLTSTSMDLADSYVTFVRQNQEIISEKGLSDELQQRIFTVWCLDTFNVLDEWLKDRPSLHIHQFNSLDLMVRMCQKDFERRGCLPSVPAVQRVQERLKVESALVEVAASSRS